MCGLAGVALHPKASKEEREWAKWLVGELLLGIQSRGTHATGIAVQDAAGRKVTLKKAVAAKVFLESDGYKSVMTEKAPTIMLGHTRWATHNNANKDEAAHPFTIGKITGAHNGIIYNWREVEEQLYGLDAKRDAWINDSQAPFGLLNSQKDPVKALDSLDGYWALTWIKGNSLFLCRTGEAPLACVYLKQYRMLVWCSTMSTIKAALKAAKVQEGEYEAWETTPGTIYRYDPANFTEEKTNGEKVIAGFKGRKVQKSWKNVDTARPPMQSTGGTSVTTTSRRGDDMWNNYLNYTRGTDTGRRKLLSISELEDLLMESLAEQEKLREEINYLFDVVRDAGLLDKATDTEAEPDDSAKAVSEDVASEDEAWAVRCAGCGKGEEHGNLYHANYGGSRTPIYHISCFKGNGSVRWTRVAAKK